MQVRGAVVLVTGASSGIGRACAVRLGAAGASPLLTGRDHDALAAAAEHAGGHPLRAEFSDSTSVAELAEAALAVHGRVDALVCSAGVGWAGPFATMPPADVEQLVTVNLTASALLTRHLLPAMLARGHGHVVLIGSIAGLVGVAGEAVYAGTKAGLATFAESLRMETRPQGVGVSLVAPGVVDTSFFTRRGVPYPRRRPRPVQPERVAEAVLCAIEQDRAAIVVPGWLALAPRVRGAAPGVYRRLAQRFAHE